MPDTNPREAVFEDLDRLIRQLQASQSWSKSDAAVQGFRSIVHVLNNEDAVSQAYSTLRKEAETSPEQEAVVRAFSWRQEDWTGLSLDQIGEKLREVERTLILKADKTYGENSDLISYAMRIRNRIDKLMNLQVDPGKPYAHVIALVIYDAYFRARIASPMRDLASSNHYPYDYALLLRICEPIVSALRRRAIKQTGANSADSPASGHKWVRSYASTIIGPVIVAGLIWFFGFNGQRAKSQDSSIKLETSGSMIGAQTNIGQINNYVDARAAGSAPVDPASVVRQHEQAALTISRVVEVAAEGLKTLQDNESIDCEAASTALTAVSAKSRIKDSLATELRGIDSMASTAKGGIEEVLLGQGVKFMDFQKTLWLSKQAKAYENLLSSCETARSRARSRVEGCMKQLDQGYR